MKKWLIIIDVLVVTLGIVSFNSKFYYPTFPINSVSKKKVLESLNDSSKDIVKITVEKNYEWFITPMEQGKAYENIKGMLSEIGWKFKTQEGSGFIFEKRERTLIAGTQMWT